MRLLFPSAILLLFAVSSCTCEKSDSDSGLRVGVYYLVPDDSDTLRFLAKVERGKLWNPDSWRITSDSIFWSDRRGLTQLLGIHECRYEFRGDTLLMIYQINMQRKRLQYGMQQDTLKYLFLHSDTSGFELLQMPFELEVAETGGQEIRSDIQLR